MKICLISLLFLMVPIPQDLMPTSMADYSLGDDFVPPEGSTVGKDLKGDDIYSIEREDGGFTMITVGPDQKIFRIMLSYPKATPSQEDAIADDWLTKYDHFRCDRKGEPELHDGQTLASLYSHDGSVWVKIKSFPTTPGLPRTYAGFTLGEKYQAPEGVKGTEYDGGLRFRTGPDKDGNRAEVYVSKGSLLIYEIHAYYRKIPIDRAIALRDEYLSKYRVYLENHKQKDTFLSATFVSPQTRIKIDWSGKFMDVRLSDQTGRGYKIQ